MAWAGWHSHMRIPSFGSNAEERRAMREGKSLADTLFVDESSGYVEGPGVDIVVGKIELLSSMGAMQNLDADVIDLQRQLAPMAIRYESELQAWRDATGALKAVNKKGATSNREKKAKAKQGKASREAANSRYQQLCATASEAEPLLAELRSAHAVRRMDLSYWVARVEQLKSAFLVGVSKKLGRPVKADIDVSSIAQRLWNEYRETYEGRMQGARFDYDFSRHLASVESPEKANAWKEAENGVA